MYEIEKLKDGKKGRKKIWKTDSRISLRRVDLDGIQKNPFLIMLPLLRYKSQ